MKNIKKNDYANSVANFVNLTQEETLKKLEIKKFGLNDKGRK